MTTTRRELLRWTLATGALLALPRAARAAAAGATLILVELQGGNDGLNTVVPFQDELYRRWRPTLALPETGLVPLGPGIGLHPALAPLAPALEQGELAVVQGVGYPRPNRSHFRSIEIWSTGSAAEETLGSGWVARVLGQVRAGQQAIVLDGDPGPVDGPALSALSLRDPRELARAPAVPLPDPRAVTASAANPALAHVLQVERAVQVAQDDLLRRLSRPPAFAAAFPETDLGRQCALAARLVASRGGPHPSGGSGAAVPVLKLRLKGFDTHQRQAGPHARALAELAGALAALRAALREASVWDDVVVATYSEFGRRPRENGSGGTDHGAAAPHLVLGGRVRGAVLGAMPSLEDLDAGDLRFTVDHRDYDASLARLAWGITDAGLGVAPTLRL